MNAAEPATGPRRTCLGCRRVDRKDALVRMVADRAGRIKIDHSFRQPGRGAYVHPERDCVVEAVRKGAFGRAFARRVESVGEDELWHRLTGKEAASVNRSVGAGRAAAISDEEDKA